MTTTTIPPNPPSTPAPVSVLPALAQPSATPFAAGLALCLLLAVGQIALAGYQLGVGNQSIQIAFLKRFANPELFSADAMVKETMPLYPSYFFRLLAPLLAFTSVDALYLLLQILTSFLTLAMVYALSRAMFKSHPAALAAAALLVAGHLRALAGDSLYSPGFTHTFAALPIALAALALAYRGRWVWAFAVAGILFNLHALTAAYTLLMLGAALLADLWETPRDRWLRRAAGCAVAVILLAAPTLILMATSRETFDATWVNLMRIRSADHSFPAAWWAAGNPDVPRFTILAALFALSWSFNPLNPTAPNRLDRAARMTLFITLATALFFVIGYVFTELWPVPLVIRLQPFRASRLLMILMLVQIAHAAITAIRLALQHSPLPLRVLEIFTASLILATIALPSFLPLLPLTLAIATATALAAGRLSWRQSIACAAGFLVAILAARQIHFSLLPASLPALWLSASAADPAAAGLRLLGLATLLITVAFTLLASLVTHRTLRTAVVAVIFLDGLVMSAMLYSREIRPDPSQNKLAAVADWARAKTSPDALFLAPAAGLSNFRILAERSLVGDWRNGTQLYFSAAFAPQWLDRVSALEPGFALSDDGKRLINPGDSLDTLDDKALITLAKKYNAAYIVLPTPAAAPRALIKVFSDDHFTAYEPRVPQVAVATTKPAGVFDLAAWNAAEAFMNTTVKENIEKHRKANVTITVVDAAGRPVGRLPVKLDQTRQAFVFGASLSFFEPNTIRPSNGDQHPPVVRPVELEKFPELFNGSMIPFSSKWQYLEPQKEQYHWSDLDKYVDFCASHDVTLEFHHLSGILPEWVLAMGGSGGGQRGLSFPKPIPAVQAAFDRHCLDTVARYADRIKYFQVVNEKFMMEYVPTIFKRLQELHPDNEFGVSDCIRFWDGSSRSTAAGPVAGKITTSTGLIGLVTGRDATAETTQYKGFDAIDWLAKQGAKPDFFGVHGHSPSGLWADPREIYNVIDAFQAKGVRVHITEEYIPLGGGISGPLRSGTWTPDLQADYLARYLAVAFSHPNVDLFNLWGLSPSGWGASGGLIDDKGKTRPAWDVLRKLFTETWRSHVSQTLSPTGTLAARVFHGTYTLTVQLPNGTTATTTINVPQTPAAAIQVRLDAAKGTLEVVKQAGASAQKQ